MHIALGSGPSSAGRQAGRAVRVTRVTRALEGTIILQWLFPYSFARQSIHTGGAWMFKVACATEQMKNTLTASGDPSSGEDDATPRQASTTLSEALYDSTDPHLGSC